MRLCLVFLLVGSFLQPVHARPDNKTPTPESRLVDGKFGKALDVSVTPLAFGGDHRYRTPPLTVECWAKLNSQRDFNILVANDPKNSSQHWEIYSYARTGVFSAYLPGYQPSEVTSKKNICDRKWHHVAMTFDGSLVRLYVDGSLAREQKVKPRPGLKPVPGPLSVGLAIDGSNRIGCDGVIDEVRLSRVLRKIDRVPTTAPAVDPDTIGVWRFDDSDTILADPAWTPPPVTTGEPWERATDADWVDARLRKMNTGPTFNGTLAYPQAKGRVLVYKGTAIRIGDKGEGGVMFDRNQLRLAVGWTGGYLTHSDRRFGLLNTPTPAGEILFRSSGGPGWGDKDGSLESKHPATAPLPHTWGRYTGLYMHGKHVVLTYTVGGVEVLESPWLERVGEQSVITRTLEVGPSKRSLVLSLGDFPAKGVLGGVPGFLLAATVEGEKSTNLIIQGATTGVKMQLPSTKSGTASVTLPASETTRRIRVAYWTGPAKESARIQTAIKGLPEPADLRAWLKAGPTRWGTPLVTKGEIAKDTAPYVVDTLTIPYENPFNALFFCTGLDFLPDGRIAMCTCHGDVWLVKPDAKFEKITWQRYATGLYHPLGLKIIDGKVVVLERGQLTRLHDLDGNGEADRYENLCHDWHTGAGEHSYDTCLETDSKGNFYFFKTGDGHLPHGGCLLRVSKDGKKVEIFATGFRHPIGLSVGPGDVVTGADQEGNWMPSTRVDIYTKGGFYGDMRTHHRTTPPTIYDPPLLWLPKNVDNSAGGQVWVPDDRFGLPKGQLLHLSYGRCRLLALLRQTVDGIEQAGAVDLGVQFLSGSARGRFNPTDGHLYVCGLNGWQTAARKDGCLQRVRYTGQPVQVPTGLSVHQDGITIEFAQKLNPSNLKKEQFPIEQWNYRWSADYGSRRWSVQNPERPVQDRVPIEDVRLSEDGKKVMLKVKGLRPVMQMRIGYDVQTQSGKRLTRAIHNTIHRVNK